jgi:hypothetical protein
MDSRCVTKTLFLERAKTKLSLKKDKKYSACFEKHMSNIIIVNITIVNVISYSYRDNGFLSWCSLGAKRA